jgi:hypothetical protein
MLPRDKRCSSGAFIKTGRSLWSVRPVFVLFNINVLVAEL